MPALIDSPKKTTEFYRRYTAFKHLAGAERADALMDFLVWIYQTSGEKLLYAILDKELVDDCPNHIKPLVVACVIAQAETA